MSKVTFGFGMVTAQRDPRDARTDTEIYADLLDLCEYAETLGFESVWLSEHHFVDDGYMPSLMAVAAAIAARTRRLRIATGILVAPLHDPLRLAEDAATVDLLSAGRLLLGIGAGYRDEEFAGLGREKSGLGAVLDHVITVLRDSWAGKPVQGAPDRPVVRITPRPHQHQGPPVWLGARTLPGIRRTARRADGLLAARVTPDEFRAQVNLLLTEAVAVGRDPGDLSVGVHRPVFAWPDADGWDLLEPHLHYSEWKYADMARDPFGARTGSPGVPPGITEATRETLRVGALVGTPEEVAAGIDEYAAAAQGLRFEFIPRLYWPGMDPQLQRSAMQVFAEQVVPKVREGIDATGQTR